MSLFNMANFQRLVISALLILTAVFLFMAQTTEAARGPKITNKVHIRPTLLFVKLDHQLTLILGVL